MNQFSTSIPSVRRIDISAADDYPTVLVCMIDEPVDGETEGNGESMWSVAASFLERSHRVYFADRDVLDHVKGMAVHFGRDDRESRLARVVAFKGVWLSPEAGGQDAFYAEEIAA